jgi:ferric-dicitrate binding protein FerR (iron transport regulator)
MIEELNPGPDERIRRAFDPDPVAASRVVRDALDHAPRALPARRLAFAAGAGLLCVAAVLALWMSPGPPEIESLNASLVDGVVVLPLPDGSASITSAEARDDRPPDGYGIVLVEGELR